MLRRIVFVFMACLFSFSGVEAQEEINNYKYIIVSDVFEIQKEANQYQLNALTEFLFNKHGYNAYLVSGDLPADAINNNCLNLKADVVKVKGGLLKTKIQIVLKDCFGNIVATSKVGESRLKQFDRAYSEALRDAFTTFKHFSYKYNPKETIEKKGEISKPENTEVKEEEELNTTPKEQIKKADNNLAQVYYAKSINNGYQLLDKVSQIAMVLLNTGVTNVFMIKDKNAVVYKENGKWIYFENNGESMISKEIKINF